MTDPRAEPFLAEAKAAVAALGFVTDAVRVERGVARLDLSRPGTATRSACRLHAEIGLDDGRLLALRGESGAPGDPEAAGVRTALLDVAARHYPAPPPMTLS